VPSFIIDYFEVSINSISGFINFDEMVNIVQIFYPIQLNILRILNESIRDIREKTNASRPVTSSL